MISGNAIGLDYHMDSVQVAVMDPKGNILANRMCHNNWEAIREAAQRHGPVARVAIEACSVPAGTWSWRIRGTWRG